MYMLLQELWLIGGPLDKFASVGHHVGHRSSVLHGLHAENRLMPLAQAALGKLMPGFDHPDVVPGRKAAIPEACHRVQASRWVQALPNVFCIGTVHCMGHHANGAVMGGIVGVQQRRQDVREMLCRVGHRVPINHALPSLLKAFHHGAFDAALLFTGVEVNVPGPQQSLEGCCTQLIPLVTLHNQWRLVRDGLHDTRHLGAALAGWWCRWGRPPSWLACLAFLTVFPLLFCRPDLLIRCLCPPPPPHYCCHHQRLVRLPGCCKWGASDVWQMMNLTKAGDGPGDPCNSSKCVLGSFLPEAPCPHTVMEKQRTWCTSIWRMIYFFWFIL